VRVTLVEVISALTRRVRSNSISQTSAGKSKSRFKRAFNGKFRHIEITKQLAEQAADLAEKYALRGYDAVQLAAAITANDARISIGASALIFVSADNDLNNAATAEGLTVENPNNYP
jgi:predicted nucleic acid-binding protein